MYLEIVKGLEGTPEMDGELGLYNKVGDLYVKVQNVNAAVEMYERAVNRYTESGFPNNAIALCNKILRSAPGRNHIYLKLAQLMIQRGFVAEAKKNFVEYAERMSAAGKLDEAFTALKRFADISPENEEIRLMLAEQLKASARDDEAREQIEKLLGETGGSAGASASILEKVRAVDPEYDLDHAVPADTPAEKAASGKTDLIFISLEDESAVQAEPELEPELELEPTPEPDPEPVAIVEEPAAVIEDPVEELIGETLDVETDADAESLDLDMEDAPVEDLVVVNDLEVEELEIEGVDVEELDVEALDVKELDVEELEVDAAPDDIVPLEIETSSLEDAEVITAEDEIDAIEVELPPLELDEDVEIPAVAAEPVDFLEGDETAPIVLPAIEDLASGEADLSNLGPSIEDLEERVQIQPDNPLHHRQLAEALLEVGERERALSELSRTLELFQGRDEWGHASGLVDEMLRLDPGSVALHQKRVEISYKGGDRSELISAYLDLADALFRDGDLEKAEAIYRRVVEHDPGNQAAENALSALAPAPAPEPVPEPEPEPEPVESVLETPEPVAPPAQEAPAPPPPPAPAAASSDYIDLGGFIMGDDDLQIKDTRMKIEEEAPTGDEQADFDQMLRQFKRGIEENIDEADGQSHYDLGVAFKEMGLVDEAIGEFQKSLRGADTRLASAEMLGHCFIEKGQLEVAATVLRRAIESDKTADGGKIGLLYWLARCEEDNSRPQDALKYYQRVVAVDVNFQDVGARVAALVKAGG